MLKYFEKLFKNQRIVVKLSTNETIIGDYVETDKLGNILLSKAVIKSDNKTVLVDKVIVRGSYIVYVYPATPEDEQ